MRFRYTKQRVRRGKTLIDSEETLWDARYEQGYCEARASEFVKKQDNWGWSCSLDKADKDDSLPEDGREEEPEKLS